jgi:hypothetical protein
MYGTLFSAVLLYKVQDSRAVSATPRASFRSSLHDVIAHTSCACSCWRNRSACSVGVRNYNLTLWTWSFVQFYYPTSRRCRRRYLHARFAALSVVLWSPRRLNAKNVTRRTFCVIHIVLISKWTLIHGCTDRRGRPLNMTHSFLQHGARALIHYRSKDLKSALSFLAYTRYIN